MSNENGTAMSLDEARNAFIDGGKDGLMELILDEAKPWAGKECGEGSGAPTWLLGRLVSEDGGSTRGAERKPNWHHEVIHRQVQTFGPLAALFCRGIDNMPLRLYCDKCGLPKNDSIPEEDGQTWRHGDLCAEDLPMGKCEGKVRSLDWWAEQYPIWSTDEEWRQEFYGV